MTYDDWKTQTPPEYEESNAETCDVCGTVFERKTDLGKAPRASTLARLRWKKCRNPKAM